MKFVSEFQLPIYLKKVNRSDLEKSTSWRLASRLLIKSRDFNVYMMINALYLLIIVTRVIWCGTVYIILYLKIINITLIMYYKMRSRQSANLLRYYCIITLVYRVQTSESTTAIQYTWYL